MLIFDEDQVNFIVASHAQGLLINLVTKHEIDLASTFEIEDLKDVAYDSLNFFIMANKRKKKLGYYLLKLNV